MRDVLRILLWNGLFAAVLAFGIWWNRGFGNTEAAATLLALMVLSIIGGAGLLAWFVHMKLRIAR
jgi:hypothetical protein